MLHVGNQDVELASVKEASLLAAQEKAQEETKEKKAEQKDEEMIDTSSKKTAGTIVNPTATKKPMTDEEY